MTAKEYLQNIRDLHLDIIAKEKDLAELKQQAESLQNTALTERVQSSKSIISFALNFMARRT